MEPHLAEILESITDCFYALDREWRFTYVNARAEAYLGVPRAGLLGRVVWTSGCRTSTATRCAAGSGRSSAVASGSWR